MSRFEPFGLTPIYAMRYGTLSIASRVGGMRDAITDAGDSAVPDARGTGVLFDGEGAQDMAHALRRALDITGDERLKRQLRRNGMGGNCGWDQLASNYAELYCSMVPSTERELFLAASENSARFERSTYALPSLGECDAAQRRVPA
ncbi:MAG: glycosyltransferase [Burkholderiaceae bacterium]|nr:glycosyltransferase [Burkholderiaceae bacterium]